MSTNFPSWKVDQVVKQTEETSTWNSTLFDNRLKVADSEIPAIINGFQLEIDNAGLVTIQPGTLIGDKFDSLDEVDISEDTYLYSAIDGIGNTTVTAAGQEQGFIVATQTLTPVAGVDKFASAINVGYDVSLSFNYRPGTAVAYPTQLTHDIVLAGVITDGALNYTIDLSVRNENKDDYYATVRQHVVSADPNFYPWVDSPATPVNVTQASGAKEITSIWTAEVEGTTTDVTFTSVIISTAAMDDVPLTNAPSTTYVKVVNTIADGTGNALVRMDIDSVSRYQNRWITVAVILRGNSASSSVDLVPSIRYDSSPVVDYIFDPLSVTLDAEWHVEFVSLYIDMDKIRTSGATIDADTLTQLRFEVNSTGTYDVDWYALYFTSGRQYVIPQENAIDQRSIKAAVLAHQQELAETSGAALVGTTDAITVQAQLDSLNSKVFKAQGQVTAGGAQSNGFNFALSVKINTGVYTVTFATPVPLPYNVIVNCKSGIAVANYEAETVNGFTTKTFTTAGIPTDEEHVWTVFGYP